MRTIKQCLIASGITLFAMACNTRSGGNSTPIDSTNSNGDASATYGPDNPASDQDTNMVNATDTGTRINEGPKTTR